MRMASVLVSYPGFGSLWLEDAEYEGEFVVGVVPNSDGMGWAMMNFPRTCIRKVQGTVPEKRRETS